MCWNAKVSFLTFSIGLIFSLILIKNGNKKYKMENKISGIFLIFIALIQLMDFFFWIDINNNIGLNKLMTIIGPILNVGQPVILYLIKYYYYKPSFNMNINSLVLIINLLYLIYFIKIYINFISYSSNLITGIKNNHLKWPWIEYSNAYFYLILLGINIFYLFDFKYGLSVFLIVYFFLLLSVKYFYYNAGELWCFFGAFTPLILYFVSFYL